MKPISFVIFGAIICSTCNAANPSANHVKLDWTPYLKPMLNGCESPYVPEKLPAGLKKSLVSLKNFHDSEDNQITRYQLNNASAFGQPLTRIDFLQGYEWGYVRLYFANDDFISVVPKFKVPTTSNISQVEKTKNGFGFVKNDAEIIDFIVDKKQKTITCESGI